MSILLQFQVASPTLTHTYGNYDVCFLCVWYCSLIWVQWGRASALILQWAQINKTQGREKESHSISRLNKCTAHSRAHASLRESWGLERLREESESDSQCCERTALLNHKLVCLHFYSSLRLTSDTVRDTEMHSYQNNHKDAEPVPFIDSKLADFWYFREAVACVGHSGCTKLSLLWGYEYVVWYETKCQLLNSVKFITTCKQ